MGHDFHYLEMVGSIMFVILGTHSDLAFVVGIVAKFSSGPKHVHCNVVLNLWTRMNNNARGLM